MKSHRSFEPIHLVLVILQLGFCFINISAVNDELPLTQNELRKKYGQENTSFNDGRSCYRVCDEKPMTCYFEFNVQVFDSMSGLCGRCEKGKISDSFRKGCVTANGVKRTIMTINQQMPGPTISVCKNDLVIVDVTNHMIGQELTIHWHGPHQRNTPWFDGVPMVTQCPIFGGNSFRYVFEAQDTGTHFYHAHSGVHRVNGLYGSLIVRESVDPNADLYDYDLDDHAILLADWNNQLSEESVPGTSTEHLFPESLLINGFGSFYDDQSKQFQFAPTAAFYVQKGKRHRFRLGNVGAHVCPFEFSVNGHKMTVIATDGSPIEPIIVDSITTLPGERFDMVLQVPEKTFLNETWMTVRGMDLCSNISTQEFARIIIVDDITNLSKRDEDHEPLKERPDYKSLDVPKISLNDPNTDCINSDSYCIASLKLKESLASVTENLREVEAEVIKLNYEITYVVQRPTVYRTSSDFALVAMVNNIAGGHPPVPGLIQDDSAVPYCNAKNITGNCDKGIENALVCYCPHLIQLELNKVYEFFLLDDEDALEGVSHSLHLHGHRFQVIDMGTLAELKSGRTAFANSTHFPVVLDTITMPSGGFVRIRFRASNPGYWLFHCHLEYHMKSGMSAIVRVGERSDYPTPPSNFPKCGHFLTPVYQRSLA